MFKSFFPKPKMFFSSAAIWSGICLALWYGFWRDFGATFGMGPIEEFQKPIGLGFFVTNDALWFYGYFLAVTALFCAFWQVFDRECRWKRWSVWGTAFLLIVT
ncbi:MAG: undecaprenol kinase protein, partial [Pseudomonadota bacterium]